MLTATRAKPKTAASLSISSRATLPVHAGSAAVFRISFGALVTLSVARFMTNGWVDELYLSPTNHLTYPGFGWVTPLPEVAMYVHMLLLACCGVAITFGYHHRVATAAFVVGFTYIELIDAALYLNHYWFMTLAAVLLFALPVNRFWSLDARHNRVDRSRTVPAWVVWALRSQVGAVYFFAGVAKLNADWLLRAQPLNLWFADRTDTFLLGPLLGVTGIAIAASWLAAAFDCTVVGWLLWRRTRTAAYVVLAIFHITTWSLFQIGVFPWVMICCAAIFFEPTWPTTILRAAGFLSSPARPTVSAAPTPSVGRPTRVALVAFAAVQLVLPLRHYAYEGNVRWTEEGYYLSWRVMLTEKAGFVEYEVADRRTGEKFLVDPLLVLTDWQAAHASTRPDMIHATAVLLENELAEPGQDLEVRAEVFVAMNGRAAAQILDPTIDLTAHDRGDLPDGAILTP